MTARADAPAAGTAGDSTEGSGRLTPNWLVLFLLMLCYTANFADRTIVNTLGEAIKRDLALSDMQLGLLGGLSFALLYSVMSIVVARFSDRHNRVGILAGAVAFWSLATMLCSMATSYVSLLLMRIGVGVGESGCSPPAQSLITDYFPPERRSTAISIYYIGVPLGMFGGAMTAGFLAESYGWRTAFLIVGAPGLLLGLAVWLILREPPRGRFDTVPVERDAPPLRAVIRAMWETPGLRHVAAGTTLSAWASYSIGQFLHPLFVRQFDLGYGQAALIYGLLGAVSAGIGTPMGGYLADLLSRRDPRWICWLPGLGLILSAPFYLAGIFQTRWEILAAFLFIPGIIHNFYHGPTFASVHNRISPRMRATSTAILMFLSAAIGLGTGPLITGFVSDLFAQSYFTGAGGYTASCIGKAAAGADAATKLACREASGSGVQMAIFLASLVYIWAGAHYFIAARRMKF